MNTTNNTAPATTIALASQTDNASNVIARRPPMTGPSDDPPDEQELPTHCVACGAELPEDGTEPTCGSLECATVYAARCLAEAEGEEAYARELAEEHLAPEYPYDSLRALREATRIPESSDADIRADLAFDAARERGGR